MAKMIGRGVIPPAEPARPASYSARRSIVASAMRVNLDDQQERTDLQSRYNSEWQERAWEYYDAIGEIHFGYNLVAAVMSRLRLYVAYVRDPDAPPVALADASTIDRPDSELDEPGSFKPSNTGLDPRMAQEARDTMGRIFERTSVSTMMRQFALNLNTPGECYLLLHKGEWTVRSKDELKIPTAGRAQLVRQPGALPVDLPDTVTIGRVWREHPRWSFLPDSSMRSLLGDCEELLLLGKLIRIVSRARMNAGLLFIPDGISAAAPTLGEEEAEELGEDDAFAKELIAAMTAMIGDESAGNSVIPFLIRGEADLGEKIHHIVIDRKVDEWLVNRADRTLERILQGLDIPKDVVTGLANVKYSNAIQIDENLYKAHVEPLALIVCDALTDICLRPMLKAQGWTNDQVSRMVVWYDPSEVTTRPDRVDDASMLYEKNELSGSALRQATGFSDADKPSEEELARRKVLQDALPPEIAMVLIKYAFPNVLKQLEGVRSAPDELPELGDLSGTEPPPGAEDLGLEPTVAEPPVETSEPVAEEPLINEQVSE